MRLFCRRPFVSPFVDREARCDAISFRRINIEIFSAVFADWVCPIALELRDFLRKTTYGSCAVVLYAVIAAIGIDF